jgi:hypothetical protein
MSLSKRASESEHQIRERRYRLSVESRWPERPTPGGIDRSCLEPWRTVDDLRRPHCAIGADADLHDRNGIGHCQ